MRVLVLVARRYNGHELWVALGVMQSRGHTADVASTATTIEDEVTGQRNTIELLIPDITTIEKWDALMIISGNMQDTEAYWRMPQVQRLVTEFKVVDKPIAAICCSVPTIRSAAYGKRVSYFPLIRSRMLLEEAGAVLSNTSVSVDGNLVTAEHQMATQVWAESFCDVLENKPVKILLKDSGFIAGRVERKPIPELEHLKTVVRTTGKTNIRNEGK